MCSNFCICPDCKNNDRFKELREHLLKDLELKCLARSPKDISPFNLEMSMIEKRHTLNENDSTMLDQQYFHRLPDFPEVPEELGLLLDDREKTPVIYTGDPNMLSEVNSYFNLQADDDEDVVPPAKIAIDCRVDPMTDALMKVKPSSQDKRPRKEASPSAQPKKRGRKPKDPEALRPQRTRKNDSQLNRKQRLLQLALNNDPILQGNSHPI